MRKYATVAWFLVALGLILANLSHAKDFQDLTVAELKAKLDAGEKMMLINPLSEIEFNEQHIPGSVNIPLHKILSSKLLPEDKDTLIVSYCKGPN